MNEEVKAARLMDAIDDARDEMSAYRRVRRWCTLAGTFGALLVIAGFATGFVSGAMGFNAGWLAGGSMFLGTALVICGLGFNSDNEGVYGKNDLKPQAKVRKAEREYRDFTLSGGRL